MGVSGPRGFGLIQRADFLALQTLLQERAGMSLTSDKLYLVGSRLSPVAQKLGMRSVIDLMTALRERPREDIIIAVIEAMATMRESVGDGIQRTGGRRTKDGR